MRKKAEWKTRIDDLRRENKTIRQCAEELGVPFYTVRAYLERGDYDSSLGQGIEPWKPREIRRPAVNTMEVARLFAKGKIDRVELSRRLRGEVTC